MPQDQKWRTFSKRKIVLIHDVRALNVLMKFQRNYSAVRAQPRMPDGWFRYTDDNNKEGLNLTRTLVVL